MTTLLIALMLALPQAPVDRIDGIVLDRDTGQPLVGALVAYQEFGVEPYDAVLQETGPGGGFAYLLGGRRAPGRLAIISVEMDGYLPSWKPWPPITRTGLMEFRLAVPRTLHGVVLDDQSLPVDSARVIWNLRYDGRIIRRAVETGSDGRFRIDSPAVPDDVTVWAPGFRPARAILSPDRARVPVTRLEKRK